MIEFQQYLKARGFDPGPIDGVWGRKTEAATEAWFRAGPDTKLSEADFRASAQRLGVSVEHVKAVRQVEASGDGFSNGMAKKLFEPHRFSKLTGARFDERWPSISYPKWDRTKYPKTEALRHQQHLRAIALDPEAGLKAASYGLFQIMGENHKAAGFEDVFGYVQAMNRDEAAQLIAFENFIRNSGLLPALKKGGRMADSWVAFARGYNGSAFRENRYHEKLAAAYCGFGGS
ncbi:N-acetylmuramidase domain-containing protein [Asticcacaulis excentricus]|uniref:Putative phage-encoded peptidoglycan binding protein n=1 Tax=Asticcacaulis excentricus TaxID=78587 RepID=A0A3G9FZV7_9CAUL|nr:N-acetylmuramidase family protein [Asticcacaulis excentricus]BBF79927.1 putative phage-encoded peptidoglycan binding protein [Asticcacaulis excentricus]